MILNLLAGLVLATNGATLVCAPGQVLNYLNITGNDVTVTDCRIRESGPGTNTVTVWGERVTLRRLLVERSGAAGVYFLSGTGHVIEDSVIRDPVRRKGADAWGIFTATQGSVIVRRNTVFGSGFGVNPGAGPSVVEDNHFVVPEDYRTDCHGNVQRDGPCQCAEFGIALKAGNSTIRRNVISGYRESDPICGGSGAPGAGVITSACNHGPPVETCPTPNVVIEANVINNSHYGVYISPTTDNVRTEGNHICHSDYAITDGYGTNSSIVDNDFNGNVVNLSIYGSHTGTVSGNRLTAVDCQ